MTPFDEDSFVIAEAQKHDLSVYRRTIIDIDLDLLPDKYLRRTPDYKRIRRALDEGLPVPGAQLTKRVEFVLTPRDSGGDNAPLID